MGYPEDQRGAIRHPEQIARLRDFRGLRFGKITPTDIDALIEFWNRAYLILEAKWEGASDKFGQMLALERLADDLGKTKRSLLLIVTIPHGTPEPIDYAVLPVSRSRDRFAWNNRFAKLTCRAAIDLWLAEAA